MREKRMKYIYDIYIYVINYTQSIPAYQELKTKQNEKNN
jgi:hypothetical protein